MKPEEIRDQFNAAASASYGTTQGDFHRRYAERLVDLTPLATSDRVLDAGTGTGLAAIAAARAVGPTGSVVGVDIAERMVEEARRAAAAAGLANVTFEVGDASRTRFSPASFDAVVCSSTIIYLPLPQAPLEWRRIVRPRGVVAFSTMRDNSPRTGVLFRETAARFGLGLANPNSIGTEDECDRVLRAAGLAPVATTAEALPVQAADAQAAWEANVRSAAFAPVRRLPPAALAEMRLEFLAAATPEILGAPNLVLFVVAERPADD